MINQLIKYLIKFFFFLSLFTAFSFQNAAEILIYADDISYDNDKNIIAKGKAKVLHNNQIISSNLIKYQIASDG